MLTRFLFAFACLFSIVCPSPAFSEEWPNPSIPLIYVDPGYVSPNDTQTFGGRDYDISDKDQAELAVQAFQAFADARAVVGAWHQSLSAAEDAFWRHYHQTGTVDPALRNELGYWLRKCWDWVNAVKGSSMMMGVQGGAQAGQVGKIIELQFGVNSEESFGFPSDWRSQYAPLVARAPGLQPSDPDYPATLGHWSRYSYLTACPCSSGQSQDPIERIGFLIAHPSGDVPLAADLVQELRTKALPVAPDKIEAYTRRAAADYAYFVKAGDIVERFLLGDADPMPRLKADHFMQSTASSDPAIQFLDRARNSTNQDRIEPNTVEFEWARGRPVLFRGQSLEQVEDCVSQNWDDIRQYVYETNPDIALRGVSDVFGQNTVVFRRSLGHVAAIACTSRDGLSDERVDDFFDFYGFFRLSRMLKFRR